MILLILYKGIKDCCNYCLLLKLPIEKFSIGNLKVVVYFLINKDSILLIKYLQYIINLFE